MAEINENLVARVSVVINAAPAKVWEALTNPAMIKQYLFGTEAVSDWKVGSPIIYRGVWEGKAYEDKGTILEVDPEKLLVMTYWSGFSGQADVPENYQKITYKLAAQGEATELTIIQENCADEEKRQHSEKNWEMVLGLMKKLVEG